MIFLYVPNLS